ncbi:MAG: YkgJ family cysteine cluster protein [Burkholderiaceae bacterium]|nr:YkgJ family cysteine cluster protein [Burkholderiaceae bacterium]
MTQSIYTRHVRNESDAAAADLRAMRVDQAVVHFYRRHDAALAGAIAASPSTMACRDGCAHCCQFKIEASAIEVLAIRRHVRATFSLAQQAQLMQRAERNVAEAAGLSHVEHLATHQTCPFLAENSCSIYPARPANCRSFQSTDASACQRAVTGPPQPLLQVPYAADVFDAARGSRDGFAQAVQAAGAETTMYDLNSAFVEAMHDDADDATLQARRPMFRRAKVIGAPV